MYCTVHSDGPPVVSDQRERFSRIDSLDAFPSHDDDPVIVMSRVRMLARRDISSRPFVQIGSRKKKKGLFFLLLTLDCATILFSLLRQISNVSKILGAYILSYLFGTLFFICIIIY